MPEENAPETQSIKERCIFCQIASGRISAKTVYSDNDVMAILDINPANPGHILLLTREHYQIMPQIPEPLIGHLFVVAKMLSQAGLRALKTTGTTIMVANGAIAGQRAPHFMMHIIPRVEGDEVSFKTAVSKLEKADLDIAYAALKKKINQLFGIEKEVSLPEKKEPAAKEEKKAEELKKVDLDKITEMLLTGKK